MLTCFFPRRLLASRVSLGEPRKDLRACLRAHFFSTLLPFSLHQHSYRHYAFLIHYCIEKCRSYRFKSSELYVICISERENEKRIPTEKKPTFFFFFLQKLRCYAQFSLFFYALLYIATPFSWILNVYLHSETHQLSNDIAIFNKFELLQEQVMTSTFIMKC
jgi:hypothetical protein